VPLESWLAAATPISNHCVFNSRNNRLPPSETLRELNERLADVETIVSFEEKVAEANNRRLETSTE
jgi:hypothetical protein